MLLPEDEDANIVMLATGTGIVGMLWETTVVRRLKDRDSASQKADRKRRVWAKPLPIQVSAVAVARALLRGFAVLSIPTVQAGKGKLSTRQSP